jgi:3-oxoacyl-[acyl-carrier-protein] synthase I
MSLIPIAVYGTGLVTSVGLSSAAACAAIRAGVTNPTETRFLDSSGEWIVAHQVPLEQPWVGVTRLVKMAVPAIRECLHAVERAVWADIPLLFCVAERERPGRLVGLDSELFAQIQQELGVEFARESLIIPHGRVGLGGALLRARDMVANGIAQRVLIAASDSLVTRSTLRAYERDERLLTKANSNGFLPGEAAGAVLVGPKAAGPQLICLGIGQATERAHIGSEEPLRGEGLASAIRSALVESDWEMQQLDLRITDISGEQYYFKEAALALARMLRKRKERFDIWHPAECIGETGAAAGVAMLCVAEAAGRKAYAVGPNILAHLSNDSGERASLIWHFAEA